LAVSRLLEELRITPPPGLAREFKKLLAAMDAQLRIALQSLNSAGHEKLRDFLQQEEWTAAFVKLCSGGCQPAHLLMALNDAVPLRDLPGTRDPTGLPFYTLRRFPERLDAMADKRVRGYDSQVQSRLRLAVT
jgi:hypothetical protein